MRPRKILTPDETAEILDAAVRARALAVLSVQNENEWQTFKSRFLERDVNRRFFVLDYQETHGTTPPALVTGQYVGVTFRHKSRKVMFATVVEARGRFLLGGDESVPAVRYRWPESMTELQRRAYYRTIVPSGTSLLAALRPTRADGGDAGADATLSGSCADISCGGALVRLHDAAPPPWRDDQTLNVELHLPDGRPAILLDAHYRGTRSDAEGRPCVAVQFVGLELSPDGRAILRRLANCVQRFNAAVTGGAVRQQGGTRFHN
ncbi:MAG: hypothetical protein D6744_05135 [Planctomycetota bacterium]|nr:MAG: hypothetical protein D6744_05135 [Planctomycetota bacterium]